MNSVFMSLIVLYLLYLLFFWFLFLCFCLKCNITFLYCFFFNLLLSGGLTSFSFYAIVVVSLYRIFQFNSKTSPIANIFQAITLSLLFHHSDFILICKIHRNSLLFYVICCKVLVRCKTTKSLCIHTEILNIKYVDYY